MLIFSIMTNEICFWECYGGGNYPFDSVLRVTMQNISMLRCQVFSSLQKSLILLGNYNVFFIKLNYCSSISQVFWITWGQNHNDNMIGIIFFIQSMTDCMTQFSGFQSLLLYDRCAFKEFSRFHQTSPLFLCIAW